MAKDNRASFEMDCSHELVLKEGRDGCSCICIRRRSR